MENFKVGVPQEVQDKLHAIAQEIEENFRGMVNGCWLECTEPRLDTIEGNYRSGWMPNQDGGFSVNVFCQNDMDSSYHFTEKQTDYNNDQQKQCWESFLSDNDIDNETSYSDLTENEKENLHEYESGWFDYALLSFEMFVDGYTDWKKDDKQVTLRASINYKDAPYYREKAAEDIKTLILEIDEFLKMANKDIIDQLKV